LAFILLAVIVGVVAGIVIGLTGSSGVTVVVPFCTMLLGMPIHLAIEISLIVDVIASIAVSATYYSYGSLDILSGLLIASGSITGAQIGASLASITPELELNWGFGVFLVVFGVYIWFRGTGRRLSLLDKGRSRKIRLGKIVAFTLGLLIGLATGIVGAGGGFMALLVLVFVLGLPLRKAVGTSTMVMVLTALSGAFGYVIHGYADFRDAFIIGVGAAFVGIFCAKFANKVDEKMLRKIIGVIFMALGMFMLHFGVKA